jgi:hypothetical protein
MILVAFLVKRKNEFEKVETKRTVSDKHEKGIKLPIVERIMPNFEKRIILRQTITCR